MGCSNRQKQNREISTRIELILAQAIILYFDLNNTTCL